MNASSLALKDVLRSHYPSHCFQISYFNNYAIVKLLYFASRSDSDRKMFVKRWACA